MANKITAIHAYCPRIKLEKTRDVKDVARIIAGRTSMNEGAVLQSLMEFRNVLEMYMGSGTPVKLPGLGTFSPIMSLDGSINISLRIDTLLLSELNKKIEGFKGNIVNRDNIGKSSDELVNIWNENNPGNLVN